MARVVEVRIAKAGWTMVSGEVFTIEVCRALAAEDPTSYRFDGVTLWALVEMPFPPPAPLPVAVSIRHTSRAAAKSIASKSRGMRSQVLHQIWESRTGKCVGLTCDQIEERLNMKHQTASARVRELAIMGRIQDSGFRRPTRTGCPAVVWTTVESFPGGVLFGM